MKKIVLFFLCIGICSVFCVFAQDLDSSTLPRLTENSQDVVPVRTDETSFLISPQSNNDSIATEDRGPSTFWVFFRMIFVLALVVVCIYLVFRFVKQKVNPISATEDPYLKHTAQLSIAPGKSVHVVTLSDKAYLLGCSENSVSLIDEITEKELIDAMILNSQANNSKKTMDFATMLSSYIPHLKKNNNKTSDSINRLKQQRKRAAEMSKSSEDDGNEL